MENKPNTGAIFKNDKKGNDKAPDYRGSIDVNGVKKDVSLWLNESKKGTKYFSVKVSEPYKKDSVSMPNDEAGDLPF